MPSFSTEIPLRLFIFSNLTPNCVFFEPGNPLFSFPRHLMATIIGKEIVSGEAEGAGVGEGECLEKQTELGGEPLNL